MRSLISKQRHIVFSPRVSSLLAFDDANCSSAYSKTFFLSFFFDSSKDDESKTSHGMVALHSALQPLPADDIRLPATVFTATDWIVSAATAEQIHPSRSTAGGKPQIC